VKFDSFPLPQNFQPLSNRLIIDGEDTVLDTRYYNQPFIQVYDDDVLHASNDSIEVYFPMESDTKVTLVTGSLELLAGTRRYLYVIRITHDKVNSGSPTMVGTVHVPFDKSQFNKHIASYSVILINANGKQTGKKVIDADIDPDPNKGDSLNVIHP
jgi:hypothetical protein